MALLLQKVILLMVCNCKHKGFRFPVTKINFLLDRVLQPRVVLT